MKKKLVNKLKIGLFGGSGKMGQEVEKALRDFHHEPYLFVGKKTSSFFAISVEDLMNIESDVLNEVDVWIDFSSAEGLFNLLKRLNKKVAVVSGSTGFTKAQLLQLKKQSVLRPLFWASNMSVGLWSFRQALKSFAAIADFDFAIEEIHHNQKKDSPSGTAITLQTDLENIVGKKIIKPVAHRLGGVFGIHSVIAASSNEILTFQHQALNRKVFATGAIQAAEWLSQQKNGLYSMDNMLFKKGI